MTLTATVERVVVPGDQGEMKKLLRELRSGAMLRPDFVPGRSLVDARSPNILLTVGTWSSMGAWENWERSPERAAIISRINALLQKDPVVRLWLDEHDAPPGAD